MVDINAADI